MSKAWCDSGFLYAMAVRESVFRAFLLLYGDTLAVTAAVAKEIRDKARQAPGPDASTGRWQMVRAAGRVAAVLGKDIAVLPLPEDDATVDVMAGRVLDQLREADAARHGRAGTGPDDRVAAANKNTGETLSIVAAIRTLTWGGTTVLLTHDGGAREVADLHQVATQDMVDVLGQLVCEQQMTDEQAHAVYEAATQSFGTLPARDRPDGVGDYQCKALGGACSACDVANGQTPGLE
ncbi:hypothetical protein ACGFZP_31870 [Kitasatospora sp. NPDC048239]|uniref:hypothetical protein n=1 Tax=Kitasatospora sp. NPDC048239 TaxID=3364046 RepID=UPI0037176221